jgi:hypothetical protein
MSDTTPPQQPSLLDHVNMQKQTIVNKAQETVNLMHNIVDSWLNNFSISEQVKTMRTDQVNSLLGFINQLANDGVPDLNKLGSEVTDPEVSNKILECNNTIMTVSRNILADIQQKENEFQKSLQEKISASVPKTEVKVQEA